MAGDTAAGELLQRNKPDVDYGEHYYGHYRGGPYERSEHWLTFFGNIADHIVRDLQPASVLDAGCAKGFLVEALRKRGVEAWGLDISEHAIARVDESVKEYCSVGSITEPLPRRYDLIVSIEVLEHLPSAEARRAVANLCSATDRVLLSSTPDEFTEPTHLNVQPPEAWSALFAREGLFRELDRDASYVSPWAVIYQRRDEPVSETVRRYDRSWSRLRDELMVVRSTLLEATERLAQLEERGSRDGQRETLKEEVLRLRDLLVAKDRELGVARGQLAAAQDQAQRYVNAASRVHPRLPAALGYAKGLVEAVRRRRA